VATRPDPLAPAAPATPTVAVAPAAADARSLLFWLPLVVLVVALLLPSWVGPFWIGLLTQMLIFGLLALSVDLLLGQAGLFSLCHGAFFAVAAYTTAILQVRYGVATAYAAPAGLLAGTLLGLIFGLSVRTRGVYFILITIAMGYVVWGVAYRWSSVTGGDNGVTNVPRPSLLGLSIDSMNGYYWFMLIVVAICMLAYRMLVASAFGLSLRGIKASESRMRSLGYRVNLHLYAAFVISAAIASLAGVLYVYYNRFINPVAASFPISVEAALMAIVGGSGTIVGPFLGSGIVLALRNWVSSFFELHHAAMGVVFIVTVLWAPTGIMGLLARWRQAKAGRR
jgi:branched-chain amino acid transport system permease protein